MDCRSLPFTRQVNQSFGSESLQVPFYALFAFFAVDRKCRFWVEPLTCLQVQVLPRQGMAGPSSVNAKHFAEGLSLLHHIASATAPATQDARRPARAGRALHACPVADAESALRFMSVAAKEILRASRPSGTPARADKYLPDIAQDLQGLLGKCQRSFSDRSVVWSGESLSELAAVLVELGEDLHTDCGLWRSLENYNQEFFGTPLPLSIGTGSADALKGFDPRRIQHLIWTLWMEMEPEVCPSPNHTNLLQLVKVAGPFLTERFTRLPGDSGVKNFLTGPSRYGWEIKRKLIWLGTKSYLFRW